MCSGVCVSSQCPAHAAGLLSSRLTPMQHLPLTPLPSVSFPRSQPSPSLGSLQTLQNPTTSRSHHHVKRSRSHTPSFSCFSPPTGLRYSLFQLLNYTLCPAPSGSQHAAFGRMNEMLHIAIGFYQFTMSKINSKIQFLIPCLDC